MLAQLGSTAAVIAIAAYIAKTWVTRQLDKMATQNTHEFAKQIAKLNVHEPYLHKRRVEVIEAMYTKVLDTEFKLQKFIFHWFLHSNIDELNGKGFEATQEFSNERGLEFCEAFTEINVMLLKSSLYFDDQFIDGVRNSYKPYFDLIHNMDTSSPPDFPEEYKNFISGYLDEYENLIPQEQEPRKSVVSLFREALGVGA